MWWVGMRNSWRPCPEALRCSGGCSWCILGSAGDALSSVGWCLWRMGHEVHQQNNLGCCFLRGLGILWSRILEDGARVAGCLRSRFAN